MSFKKVLAAAAVGLAFFNNGAALAVPLSSITGAVEFKLSGVTTGFFTQTNTNEATWGVGKITQITTLTSAGANTLWNSGEGGDHLGFMLYGAADLSNSGTSPNLNLYNVGATGTGCGSLCNSIYIDMFKRTSDASWTTPSLRAGPGGGYNAYPGVSDGLPLWLRLQLVPGIVADDPNTIGIDEGTTATLSQSLNSLTLPAAGSGTFYANVIGGSAMASYNSNGFTTLLTTTADMLGIFSLTDNTTGSVAGCNPASINCFFGLIRDPVTANVVPEPGSIALLGLGLLVMGGAGLGRRRMAQFQG